MKETVTKYVYRFEADGQEKYVACATIKDCEFWMNILRGVATVSNIRKFKRKSVFINNNLQSCKEYPI